MGQEEFRLKLSTFFLTLPDEKVLELQEIMLDLVESIKKEPVE